MRELLADGRCREDFRQFVQFGVGYAIVLLLGYLLLRKINLTLSEVELGRFSYVNSLAGIASLVLSLAAPQAYLRFHDDNRIPRGLRRILLPLLLLAMAGVAAIVWCQTHCLPALAYAALPFFDERIYVFRGQLRAMSANALKVVQILIPLAGLHLLSGRVGGTAGLVFALYGLGYLSSFLFPLRLSDGRSPGRKTVLAYLSPIVVTMFLSAIAYDLLVIVTKWLYGLELSAQVGVATRNLIFVRAAFTVFMMLFPVIYFREMRARRFGTVRLYRAIVLALSALFCALMAVGAPLVYRMTGAAAYVGSSAVFSILTVAAFLDFLFDVFGLYFQLEIRTWKNLVVRICAFVFLLGGMSAVALCPGQGRNVTGLAFAVLLASSVGSGSGTVWVILQERRMRCGRAGG